MPVSRYDPQFGGRKGSASKALAAMKREYGAREGEQVFYATNNARKKRASQHLAGR